MALRLLYSLIQNIVDAEVNVRFKEDALRVAKSDLNHHNIKLGLFLRFSKATLTDGTRWEVLHSNHLFSHNQVYVRSVENKLRYKSIQLEEIVSIEPLVR